MHLSLSLDWRVVVFDLWRGTGRGAALRAGAGTARVESRCLRRCSRTNRSGASARLRLRSTFVVAQVALSLVLIVVGGSVYAGPSAGDVDRGRLRCARRRGCVDRCVNGWRQRDGGHEPRARARGSRSPGARCGSSIDGSDAASGGRSRWDLVCRCLAQSRSLDSFRPISPATGTWLCQATSRRCRFR